MKFCEKLRKCRIEAGMTQGELADELGVTCRTVQNYESGSVYPQKRDLYDRLAEVLGRDADFWISEAEDMSQIEKSCHKESALARVFRIREIFLQDDMTEQDLDECLREAQESYWYARERLRGRR